MLNFVKTKAKFLSRCSTPVVRSCEPLRQARQNDDREGLVHSRGKYLNPRRTNQESKFDFDAGLYYNIYIQSTIKKPDIFSIKKLDICPKIVDTFFLSFTQFQTMIGNF